MLRCFKLLPFILFLFLNSGCFPIVLGAATTTGVTIAQERTVGDAVDDATIWTKIKSDMLQKNVEMFRLVDVKVTEGRVLLTGSVPTAEAKIESVRIAWNQRGVKEVMNEMKVASPTGKVAFKNYTLDTWITAQIKSKLLLDKEIRSVNYSIETVDQVVYIMGIALNQHELDKVTNLAGTVKYVERVISYVRVRGSKLRQPNQIYE